MTTTTHAWPEQLAFPGQAAAHAGPVDMMMMYVMHHGFRRDLTAFAAAAQATPVDDREAWRALSERWDLFSEVLHHHHSGEDAGLWPLLMERTDDDGRRVLEAMEAEHEQIDPILTACAAGFQRLAGHADEDARAALAVRLCAARESLAQHLRHEETEAIAIIQQVLDHDDWERLEEEHFRKGVPFSQVLRIVPWAAHDVPGPLRRQVFAKTGKVNELLWRLTRGGFERRERVAFRHVA
jgi:iron-sulfur cluster repair protein YtfE (RIC family)